MATLIIDGSGTGGAEPRRRFSDDDKARIVSEAMMPGASVLDVARRYPEWACTIQRLALVAGAMIRFENVPEAYKVYRHWKPVFNNLHFAILHGDGSASAAQTAQANRP